MREVKAFPPTTAELKRHFQNYFELLLGAERAKLQRTIALGTGTTAEQLFSEVEQRIAYLKGAVRMGTLLCLINSEEAKLKHELLMTERESLLANCEARFRHGFAQGS
jgi:hypothetical protein